MPTLVTNKPRSLVPETVSDDVCVLESNFCFQTSLAVLFWFDLGSFLVHKIHTWL